MAVVIRLQGLPMVAGTMDIRHFFSGLTIPDGGVHIVGGERGEAFIVFATDEDARVGMMRAGGAIKGAKVSLLLSSKTEMQNTIELSRRRFDPAPSEATPTRTAAPPTAAQRPNPNPQETKATPNMAANMAANMSANMAAAFPQSFSAAPGFSSAQSFSPAHSFSSTPSFNPAPSFSSAPSFNPASSFSSAPSFNPAPTLASLTSLTPSLSALPQMPSPMSHLLPPFNPALPPPMGGANPLLFPMAPPPLSSPLLPPVTPLTPDDLVLCVQNLPGVFSEGEVSDFLRGRGLGGVESVRLVRDSGGRGTGRALVRFLSPQDSYTALKQGGGTLGSRYVEIVPASQRQWDGAEPERRREEQRARSRSPHGAPELCVFLKGLPYEVDSNMIKEFFKGLRMVDDSLYIAYAPNGKATGEGFVEFHSEHDHKMALAAHMQYMGARFIQVHPISRRGMIDKIEQIRKRENDNKNTRAPKTCVHITNIPYNVTRKDVRGFLEGVGLVEDTLQVLTDGQGNGLGQAVVQLRSEDDARKAERLHRQKLNGRDAFVHLVTYEHMKDVEKNPPPQNKRGTRLALPTNPRAPPTAPMGPPPAHMAPPPAFGHALSDDFAFLRSPAPFAPPFSSPGNGLAPPPTHMAPPPLVLPPLDSPFRGGAHFGHEPRGPAPFDDGLNRNHGNNAPSPSFPPDPAMRNAPPPAANANGGGPTVVKLQNMPFTVTADEIMDFFYGYAVVPGSVCLQFNDKGLKTGEAMVAFSSADEASAAVSELNDRPIGSRKVKISLG
ncbi:unnamed protein product [Knipowitschia caucasica]|uniref:RRM domain-containing protein n=2 Tax=Knipowitschia caucasica TaxID=637954 RepID=A0AAV2MHZ0_KNICA